MTDPTHRRPRRAALLLLALPLLAWACGPPPSTTDLAVGDSLTMTTLLDDHLDGYDVHSMLGWEAEDAQPGLTQRVADPARNPRTAVVALGANDAAQHTGKGPEYGDGFTATDRAQLLQLRDTFHPDTGVTWVLPHYAGIDPLFITGINAYRTWATTEAARRGDCVVDWRTWQQPGDIDPADGIHLTAAGKARYAALIEEATSCA
jgi:lysophospholipase L1-like esterase